MGVRLEGIRDINFVYIIAQYYTSELEGRRKQINRRIDVNKPK